MQHTLYSYSVDPWNMFHPILFNNLNQFVLLFILPRWDMKSTSTLPQKPITKTSFYRIIHNNSAECFLHETQSMAYQTKHSDLNLSQNNKYFNVLSWLEGQVKGLKLNTRSVRKISDFMLKKQNFEQLYVLSYWILPVLSSHYIFIV